MFSRYCSEYLDGQGHAFEKVVCFLMLVNYFGELFYVSAKYQWLYLRVCHIRKFRFFLPFLTRRETISIQRRGSVTRLLWLQFCPLGFKVLRCLLSAVNLPARAQGHSYQFHAFVNIYSFRFCRLLSEQLGAVVDNCLLAKKKLFAVKCVTP